MYKSLEFNALIPCRKGSQRIVNKNTKRFGSYENGLLSLKIEQLLQSSFVDRIIISTDDPVVVEISEKYQKESEKEICIVDRPAKFAIAAPLDEFVSYVSEIIPQGILIWTHVTSPFFEAENYDNIIKLYYENVIEGGFDSLMTVMKEQTFIWDKNQNCISHNRDKVAWPQTQDLDAFYLANSAAFMISKDNMQILGDRIGRKPYFSEINKLNGLDIDWPEDFEIAEKIFEMRLKNGQ